MAVKVLMTLTPSQLIGAYVTAYCLANPQRKVMPNITYSGGCFRMGPKKYRKSTIVAMTEAWFAKAPAQS